MATCKAADKHKLAIKESFFNRLQALNESSEEEEDKNEIREIIRKCKKSPSATAQPAVQRVRTPATPKELPALQRAISAPVSSISVVKETPALLRHQSLLREKIITPSASGASVIEDTPIPTTTKPQERRTVSTPAIGTDLILNYSTGIESMLGKKGQKRKKSKESSIKLVPEKDRIFKDLTFYYIPPNEVAPLRRHRITKAREFGVTWAGKEWTPGTITHVVVDKVVTFEGVMKFLKLDTWPSNITLVNEDYPIDCIEHKFLLDPKQDRYAIAGQNEPAVEEDALLPNPPQTFDRSLVVKAAKSKTKIGSFLRDDTPPRSQEVNQRSAANHPQLAFDTFQEAGLEGKEEASTTAHSPLEASPSEHEPNKRQRLSGPRDDLDEMITLARGMTHLPLNDEDEEDNSRPSSRDDPETSGSDEEPRRAAPSSAALKAKKKGQRGMPFNQDTSSCMTGGTGVTPENNPNARTIEVLQEMMEYYDRTKDHWRQTAYKKAISTLRRQSSKISTYEEALALPTIGDRLAHKIEEIVLTNRLRRLENAKAEPSDEVLATFMKIYGVGLGQAGKWVQQGYKTVDDLLAHAHLTDNQKLGIERCEDLLTRIPRDEVTALGAIVKSAAAKIDSSVQVTIGGSYRRGAATSGDIDCLLTKPGTKLSRDLLPFVNRLVTDLTAANFLVAALAVPSETGSASKWHGCCVLPGGGAEPQTWRRIDFLLVPETELGAALIYFTGDDIFNRSLRLLSSRKGWRLNQRGLFKDVMRGPGRVKMTEGELMEGADEKRIFDLLAVPWRPPEQRICR